MNNMFGENLKRIREERGLSQEQLAGILDTSKQVISRYETGQRSPKINTASEYAIKLNVALTELTGYEEKPATSEGDGLILTDDELEHLRLYRSATPELQAAALAMLEAAEKARLARNSDEAK